MIRTTVGNHSKPKQNNEEKEKNQRESTERRTKEQRLNKNVEDRNIYMCAHLHKLRRFQNIKNKHMV